MVKQKLELVENWQKEKELLVLGFFEASTSSAQRKNGKPTGTKLGNKIISNLIKGFSNVLRDFQGKFGQKALLYRVSPKRILFVGLGKKEQFNLEKHKEIAAKTACYVRDLGMKTFSTELFGNQADPDPQRVKAQVEGQGLGLYRFEQYKKSKKQIEEIKILIDDPLNRVGEETKEAFEQGLTLVEAVCFVRDLINSPASEMHPQKLAYTAQKNVEGPKTTVNVLDKRELENKGMNLILAVGRGSEIAPRLIEMEYKPENPLNKKPYVLVGKGVCFDSGGLQIKPGNSMVGMHADMAGGAVVIGTLKAVAELNLPLWVVGLVPTVENMVSDNSYKPGDIIKAYNGKTIEIGHTDAEGRLILFDTLAYAKEKFNPCLIIDIATLTGACVVALGEHYAGLLGNSSKFLKKIKKAGQKSGERVWELPLDEKYFEQIKSEVADLKNIGGQSAGTITAACFLHEAVGKRQPWLHIDIAGAAKVFKVGVASGFGVRLFVQFLLNEIKNK